MNEYAGASVFDNSQLLEKFFENTLMHVAILDKHFNFIRVNEVYARADNRNPSDFIGHNHFEFYPNEENENIFKNVVKTGKPYNAYAKPFEYIMNPERGVTYWDWNLIPIINGDGNVQMLILTLLNVTDRIKVTEKYFIQSQIIEQAPCSIFSMDSKGYITSWNAGSECLFGYTPSEIIGNPFSDIYLTDKNGTLQDKIVDPLMRNGVLDTELYLQKKSDIIVLASVSLWLVKDSKDVPFGMVGHVVDITEQKKAETEKARLISAIEQVSDMIVITNINGNIVYVNPAFEKITGYSKEEVIGKNPRIMQSGEQKEEFYSNLWKTILSGNNWLGRFTNKKKDGTLYIEEANITPVRIESGEIMNFVAVKRDITDEVKMEEKLHQLQKIEAIGQLAGGIAHDYNNQLTAIVGFSELLLNELNDPKLKKYTEKILQVTNSSKDLTHQLLAFARKGKYKKVSVNIHETINKVIQLLEHSINKNIEIRQNLQASYANVLGDPTQLENVILNLSLNARDAMPNGGKLIFETDNIELNGEYCNKHLYEIQPGSYIKISVVDTGIGMDKELQSRIFEPFFTTKNEQKGTGMGLASAYGTITAHKGTINVYSEPGRGSTFTLFLPFIKDKLKEAKQAEKAILCKKTGTILLVDDERLVLEVASRMLENIGCNVIAKSDGVEALKYYKANWETIDLVLLDMTMPKMSGKETFFEMKKINRNVKIILSSGYSMHDDVREILSQGGLDFIQKPYSSNELSQIINNFL